VYHYIAKLCGHKAEVVQNHGNELLHSIGKEKPKEENIRSLNLVTGGQMTKLPL
jgi:hypothetical protein